MTRWTTNLAHEPLSTVALKLPVAGADVVGDCVASNVVRGVVLCAPTAGLADNDAHLDLEVEFLPPTSTTTCQRLSHSRLQNSECHKICRPTGWWYQQAKGEAGSGGGGGSAHIALVGEEDRSIGVLNAAGELAEHHRLGRNWHVL